MINHLKGNTKILYLDPGIVDDHTACDRVA